jgi:hypothetical protein
VRVSRQRRRFGSYPAATGPAVARCTLNSPDVAVSTILHELRFLRKFLWTAVAETVVEAPYSSVVTAEEALEVLLLERQGLPEWLCSH